MDNSSESNPKYGFVKNPEIKDRDGDGLPELMVKFSKSDVQSIVTPGVAFRLTVSGEIAGVAFAGSDVIKVI